MRRADTFVKVVTGLGAASYLGAGAWAFLAPRSFYDTLATFPPYNEHFLHDIGSFQIGLGAALLAALLTRDGIVVALAGSAAGGFVHFVSHVIDRDLGGSSTDPISLGMLVAAVALALWLRARSVSTETPDGQARLEERG